MRRIMIGTIAAALGLLSACGDLIVLGGADDDSGAAGGGVAGSGGSGGSGGSADGAGGAAGGQGGGACQADTATAMAAPTALFILVDRSGSMSGANWNGVTQELQSFFNDLFYAGLEAALTYMPAVSNNGLPDCDPSLYTSPAVPPGPLPQNAPVLIDSLNAADPLGSTTPLYGALFGTLQAATFYKDAHPAQHVAVVVVGDLDSNSCPGNQNDIMVIAGLAASALAYNGVVTYTWPVAGSNLANANLIAQAGDTGHAFSFMSEIAWDARSCDFILPPPPDPNQPVDPAMINIELVPDLGLPAPLPHVADEQGCAGGHAWYYHPGAPPAGFRLCDATCDALLASPSTQVLAAFGCPTVEL